MGLAELVQANQDFYDAFCARDLEAMGRIWAVAHPVICGHPGWPLLQGREEVLASFRSILTAPEPPQIRCRDPRAMAGGGLGCVVCSEQVGDDELLATNVFVLEEGLWRMVHHHASAVQGRPRPRKADGWLN